MEPNTGSISIVGTLFKGNQLFFINILNLKSIVETLMMLNALVAHNRTTRNFHKIALKDRKISYLTFYMVFKVTVILRQGM